ncbi:MAG: DUF3309 family protein [Enhydrobacter sp.]|nr:DUF3309 family protein [Enhydrobacter sp.]
MLVLGVAIVLAILSIATFPCWTYSARWGFTLSTLSGTLLLCVAMVVIGSKYISKTAEREVAMAKNTRLAGLGLSAAPPSPRNLAPGHTFP